MISEATVKENIRTIREEAGLTQKETALRMGISRTSFRKLEKAGTSVISPQVYRFAQVTDVPMERIILGDEALSQKSLMQEKNYEERLRAQRDDYEERLSAKDAKIREKEQLIDELRSIIDSQKTIIAFMEKHAQV